jgi:hypothetical protein
MDKKVIEFPKKPVRNVPAKKPANDDSVGSVESSTFRKGFSLLKGVGRFLQFGIYVVMCWLRWLVVGACSLLSAVMLILWLFSLYAFPDKTNMVWGFGTTSLISFFVAFAYDHILMRLSPVPMVNTL